MFGLLLLFVKSIGCIRFMITWLLEHQPIHWKILLPSFLHHSPNDQISDEYSFTSEQPPTLKNIHDHTVTNFPRFYQLLTTLFYMTRTQIS